VHVTEVVDLAWWCGGVAFVALPTSHHSPSVAILISRSGLFIFVYTGNIIPGCFVLFCTLLIY
jgi:hypothetical protein